MRRIFLYSWFLLILPLMSCNFGPNSGRGFSLPEGDIEAGRTTFVELECNACHSIGEIELISGEGEPDIKLPLGGQVTAVKTYGDLVTSVINPSHKIRRPHKKQGFATAEDMSRMTAYNDVMTVQQLVDLVTFLESSYEVVPAGRTVYPTYKLDSRVE